MATIDTAKILAILSKDATGKLYAAAAQRAKQVFNDAVIGMQQEFEEHPVTREIDGGISADNISETLLGGDGPQNLTSFIGFPEGSHPTEPIRRRLSPTSADGPKLSRGVNVSTTAPRWEFTADITRTRKSIYANTPIPWAPGLSWAEKIETDIPGFAHFLDKYMESDRSRSGGGIQVEGEVRQADFTPPVNGYMDKIFEDFLDQIRAYARGGLRTRFRDPGTSNPQVPL